MAQKTDRRQQLLPVVYAQVEIDHHPAAQETHAHTHTHTHAHARIHRVSLKGQLCTGSPPELMTHTMSSMVTAVSAILVARMSLRTPGGGRMKTLRWSWVGTMECRGSS